MTKAPFLPSTTTPTPKSNRATSKPKSSPKMGAESENIEEVAPENMSPDDAENMSPDDVETKDEFNPTEFIDSLSEDEQMQVYEALKAKIESANTIENGK